MPKPAHLKLMPHFSFEVRLFFIFCARNLF